MTSDLHPIRLEPAREPGNPAGDRQGGYGIAPPLDAAGRLDPRAARTMETSCRVRRFADEETVATGWLMTSGREGWIPDCPGDADDETGFRFGEECFVPGEYVSLQAPDGATHSLPVGQSRAS